MPIHEYNNLVDALNDLKARGFDLDFNLAFDKIKCVENEICLAPSQFEIVETYRFEGASNPDDSSILYAITSNDGTMKGTLISAYGVYSDESIDTSIIEKLTVNYNIK
ncbi:phosphoribosylpyrophosphate synthetase [Rhizosphaericola mali]|uniref:Phosphoribosylpyrophosphate synthetase n=1 Tax=Rhizosphaericola mali TaxID=2545455 RepID=A0A5P2FZS1_9BACT|nr:phosphoribosylpyrophosphate synthetase [Rhizosphaericola mali]QES87908.1 phosphoribosylpyrophosphate synthetase [Rhizosphaericola mali]